MRLGRVVGLLGVIVACSAASTAAFAAVETPTGVAATAITSNRIFVRWTASDPELTGFAIERSLKSGTGFKVVGEVDGEARSYQDGNLSPSTTYYYRVRAARSRNLSRRSEIVNATTLPDASTQPTVTRTATPARTATRTPTPTRTATPARTATRTATPAQQATRTATPVRTATRTATPTPTRTATPLPTSTRTATPVRTSTPAPTPPASFDPLLIGFVPGVGSAQDVSVVGTTAFVASDPFGLSAVDAGVPSQPIVDGTPSHAFVGGRSDVRGTRGVVTGVQGGLARLWVLDVSAAQPQVLGELGTSAASILDVAMNDPGTLAVTAMGAAGLLVIDISNPAAPSLRATFDTAGTAFAVALNGPGTLAYVADGSGGIKVVSLANPSAPVQVGSLALSGIQRDVAVQNNVAYLVDQMGRLVTVDVATPSAPRQLGAVVIGRYVFHVAVEGTRAVTHSADSVSYLDVIDVSSSAAPVVQSSLAVDTAGGVKGVALSGGRAYVANGVLGLKIYSVGSAPALSGGMNDAFSATRIATATSGRSVVTGAHVPTNSARLRVIDTTDPTVPGVLGELATTTAAAGILDVAVNGAGTLAVTAMGTSGIWVVDLANPAAPIRRGVFDTAGTAFAVALSSTGSLAYVADGAGGLKVLSLANLNAPTQVGSLAMSGIQRDIAIQGSVAYLADQMGRLVTVDVGSPNNPQQLGALTIGRYSFNVAVSGSLVVLHTSGSAAYLDVIDVTSPSNPVLRGTVAVDASGAVKGVAIGAARGYVASGAAGLRIYDLANPSNPALVGSGYTVGSATDVAVGSSLLQAADSAAVVSIIDLFGP